MLLDGPIAPDPDWSARERWFVEDLQVGRDAYRTKSRPCLKSLDEGGATVLWFEDDFFCHANLLYVLSRAPTDGSWSLVCPPEVLAGRTPSELRRLFEQRSVLGAADVRGARQLWEAFSGPDPRRIEALVRSPSTPPAFARTLRLHLTRFPDTATGLDAIEAWMLDAIEGGPQRFRDLFGRFALEQRAVGWGVGDTQVAWRMQSLAGGHRPLVRIEGDLRDPATWRLSLTPDGGAILRGGADRVDLVGLDRWIGGVRVASPGPIWRWDARASQLVRT